jgi:hypothetical protein
VARFAQRGLLVKAELISCMRHVEECASELDSSFRKLNPFQRSAACAEHAVVSLQGDLITSQNKAHGSITWQQQDMRDEPWYGKR